jgi:hypothetical protein
MKFLIGAITALLLAGPAAAGTENIDYPKDYKAGFTFYTSVDKTHPKRGPSIRDMLINPAGLAAARAGNPMPSGTVIVMEVHKAKKNADGKGMKNIAGKYTKAGLNFVFVMEKRTGWGAEYPASLRNGEWEYAWFKADGSRHPKRDMKSCFGCHKRVMKSDYVFTLKQLKAFATR